MPGTQSNRVRPRKAKGFPTQQLFILCEHNPLSTLWKLYPPLITDRGNSIMQNLRADFFLFNLSIYLPNDCVFRGNCMSIECSNYLVELITDEYL